jgi:hypothetical protein
LYRGIYGFKNCYQRRNYTAKDEKGEYFADNDSILARWRKYFSQVLNVHEVNDVRQTEIHTLETLVTEPNASEFELAIEKLECHKSPGIV